MTTKQDRIEKVEEINDSNVRVHFTDGTTLRMSRHAYETGAWKKGTSLALVREIQG